MARLTEGENDTENIENNVGHGILGKSLNTGVLD